MDPVLWLVAGLVLPLASDWQLEQAKLSDVPAVIPDERVAELGCVWRQPSGAQLTLVAWDASLPPRPGGPLEVADEWQAEVLGASVRMARTTQWMGARQEVLVAWLPLEAQHAYLLLTARDLPRETFVELVRGLRRQIDRPLVRDDLVCRPLDAPAP